MRHLLIGNSVSEEEQVRRPSLRTLTIRYVLSHVKYLHEGAKSEIIRDQALCNALFHHLRDDPSEIADEILTTLEQCILKDEDLKRSAKSSLLSQHNLERVAEVATRFRNGGSINEKAFEWLRAVCSTTTYGLFRPSGWYPAGTASHERHQGSCDYIDLGLDSIDFYDRRDRPDVRNPTLLAWIKRLRPHSNSQQRDLVLTCFESASELVAAFFAEGSIQLEPKLSNTWIGYASFLFEVIRLPVPQYLGNESGWAPLPPQTNVMIENILPRPLTQKVLTRCLNQSSELITLFAIRILVLAFQKLSRVRSELTKGGASSENSDLWIEASERLSLRFNERCPSMRDVITVFRKMPDDDEHTLQREAITRLLQLYYEVTPMEALAEIFDVSSALTSSLVRSDEGHANGEIGALRALELEHLLQIARHSPGMRWSTTQGSLAYSPITALLGIHAKDRSNREVRDLIYHVLSPRFSIVTSTSALDALVAVVREIGDLPTVLPFLDDCIRRGSQKPLKYLDDLEATARGTTEGQEGSIEGIQLPSFLVAVFLEQASFVVKKPKEEKQDAEAFISKFVDLLLHTEEKCEVLEIVRSSISELEGFEWNGGYADPERVLEEARLPEVSSPDGPELSGAEAAEPTISFRAPPIESEDHPELLKWSQHDLETALEEGHIESLMLCLCSQFPEIRMQARTQLHKAADLIFHSTLKPRIQIYNLVGQLIETYEVHCLPKNEALPYLAGCFATHALKVQMDPTHDLYPKINTYLNKAADWRIRKMPNYWIDKTFYSMPEEHDSYWKEVQWVVDWLVDGLRTTADMDILRRGEVFDKVSVCALSAGSAHKMVGNEFLELIWRATFVEGGSTTLITRSGILNVLASDDEVKGLLKQRVLETCDKAKVEAWSGLNVDQM